MLTTTTATAGPDIKQGRTRALCAAGGALAAALAWIVEVPLLGIHLNYRFGTGHIQTIAHCSSGTPRMPGSSGPRSRWRPWRRRWRCRWPPRRPPQPSPGLS
jgi:hypothetical protein